MALFALSVQTQKSGPSTLITFLFTNAPILCNWIHNSPNLELLCSLQSQLRQLVMGGRPGAASGGRL
jgi:hypothetical protein